MQARAWLPAAFQLPLSGMCVSVSGLQPSPSAPTPLRICQHKKKRAPFCFSSPSQTHALSFLCFISFVLSTTTMRRSGLQLLPRQTAHPSTRLGSGCWICFRLFPSGQQVHPGPACHAAPGLIAWCQPDTVPQLPSLCHIHHRHSDDFAGPSSSTYIAPTQLSHYHYF